ncbi:hypothetical protein PCL_12762 [Purpureocillium lilacinum]|uniref:Uncharacterized protein n=1 Tax=Purpureocillium lilacinum TaxID=33203 RepID=A0A2U3E787_PURLI|nr:hypothetical protein PCL_12762 [Purpureocillium lilacinum]
MVSRLTHPKRSQGRDLLGYPSHRLGGLLRSQRPVKRKEKKLAGDGPRKGVTSSAGGAHARHNVTPSTCACAVPLGGVRRGMTKLFRTSRVLGQPWRAQRQRRPALRTATPLGVTGLRVVACVVIHQRRACVVGSSLPCPSSIVIAHLAIANCPIVTIVGRTHIIPPKDGSQRIASAPQWHRTNPHLQLPSFHRPPPLQGARGTASAAAAAVAGKEAAVVASPHRRYGQPSPGGVPEALVVAAAFNPGPTTVRECDERKSLLPRVEPP